MTTWDDTFEASPKSDDEAKYGATKIREIKTSVSEREELEHNFKLGTSPFHKPGLCSVVFIGTTVEIAALTGMSEGSIAFDLTLGVYKLYHNFAWLTIALDHNSLANLDNTEHTLDPHPQYLKLNKAGQVLTENLALASGITIDGVDISEDQGKLSSLILCSSVAVGLTFVSSSKEIRRASGSFLTDSFAVNDIIYTTSVNGTNKGPLIIDTISATSIVVKETIVDEASFTGKVFSINKGFETWFDGSYVVDIVYGPEPTDCFITASSSAASSIIGYIGITNVPTTILASTAPWTSSLPAITFPVAKGQWWKITNSAGVATIRRMKVS
jgi:hypothetical protein